MSGSPPGDPLAFDRLRAQVMGDEAVQLELSRIDEAERFAERAAEIAAGIGAGLSREFILAALRPDPLRLMRGFPPVITSAWPSRHWLPSQVSTSFDGAVGVDWVHLGGERLVQPFFEQSLSRALGRPFNRMFGYRTTLSDFIAGARADEAPAPDGFIFHMSRCGSTLVAQMLAALPSHIVVSEAAPLDAAVQLDRGAPPLAADGHAGALAAMVAALGRRRFGGERHYVLKLDAWHTLALPLFRRVFPQVPWVFLYRDPIEVLVSQMAEPGMQMIPNALASFPFGIENGAELAREEHCARVLEKICAAALDNLGFGGGLVVNYDELPEAVRQKILPHFGIGCSAEEEAAMRAAAGRDAKAPYVEFVSDADAKQRRATDRVRAAARRHLDGVYGALQAMR
ncbi:MAG TPA: hypothetical protein VGG57_08725 [Stellaceae bacterium]|jgi:hypothetical protein